MPEPEPILVVNVSLASSERVQVHVEPSEQQPRRVGRRPTVTHDDQRAHGVLPPERGPGPPMTARSS